MADRVVEFMRMTEMSQSEFGKRIGRSGYQLIYSWTTDQRKPSVDKLVRVVALARSLGYTYTLDSFMAGTVDEKEVQAQDSDDDAVTGALDRAGALVWIDDRPGLIPAVRQRMRDMLRKYPQRSWRVEYLVNLATELQGLATDLQAHRAADAEVQAEVRKLESSIDVTDDTHDNAPADESPKLLPPPPCPSGGKKKRIR